ncbi:DegT/DnrJ/EryC1/StrS family aminotransferase [Haloechinothrix sp. LS1_15]|uniref:DegT/DnrJ/EryC1/StrS family aminotransferase n=1 Tax=Haloechinothrix sp. LS1_15 TaxID=2652248 RepID=UPI0029457AAC|nr:DegT/DnrJ/EryC1/StrS family aminotransferase [Haloechinothrix sp. LS1_15]MDV6011230.1 aminotransferase class V-fold PLP-dependent enzyme [Haloechinothrix sp. LS1_15]
MNGNHRPIPFLDLAGIHDAIADDLDLVWHSVRKHGYYTGGPEVDDFETAFATYCEASHCIGVGNGTDALELILTGLGIGRGDEVIVPANTFVATAEAVCAAGARPSFVDVNAATLLLDPAAAAAAITRATAAIIGVHLYGQMADVDALVALARRHGLAFIEDAAQAHGARFGSTRAGSAGIAAAFSFYPGKNLGAFGDGGSVVTSDPQLAERVRTIANHGRAVTDRHRHELAGRNSRLDTLQAGVLATKLPLLDESNARRAAAMACYRTLLPDGYEPLAEHPYAESVHHLAVVRTGARDRATAALTGAGIGWGIHYPVPCHQQPAFERFPAQAPVAEQAAGHILSLPMSPTLGEGDIARICAVLRGVRT